MSREDDPDVDHLLDLLRMLPGPKENPRFWAGVRTEGESIEPVARNLDYIFEKMTGIHFFLRDRSADSLVHLCKYLLFFFSGDRPGLWKILNDLTETESSWGQDDTGRWWAEDMTRTAWALHVRYQNYGDETWKDKWHFDRYWTEWRPPRDE